MSEFQPHSLITAISEPSQGVTVVRGVMPMMARVNGRRHLRRVEPRCHVCSAPDEVQKAVHYLTDQGSPVRTTIAVVQSSLGYTITRSSLHRHLTEHYMSGALGDSLMRSSAAVFGVMEPEHLIPRYAAQAVLQKGFAAVATGAVEVNTNHLLAAAKMLMDLDSGDAAIQDVEMYQEAFVILLGAVYKSVGPTKFQSIVWELSSSGRMSEILGNMGFRNNAEVSDAAVAALEAEDDGMRRRRELIHSF